MSEENSTIEPLTTEEIEQIRAYPRAPWKLRMDRTGWTLVWNKDENFRVLIASDLSMTNGLSVLADREAIPRLIATLDARDKTIAERDAIVGEHERARRAENAAFLAQRDEAERLAVKLSVAAGKARRLEEDLDEIRRIVDAKLTERTDEAVRRALKEIFDTSMAEMTNIAGIAADQIEENMRVGAKGMRDACAHIAGALSKDANPFVAETSRGIRNAIEALPLP